MDSCDARWKRFQAMTMLRIPVKLITDSYRIGDSFQVPSLTAAAALLVAAALTFRLRV
jgi:hypothetical protein